MARTVQEIYQINVTNLVATFGSVGITINPATWSQTNFLRLVCYSIAIGLSLFEQLQDVYLAQLTEIQAKSNTGTEKWLQDKMFKFQYSATNPQYLTFVGTNLEYQQINPAYQIIKACAIQSSFSGAVNIKVAKDSPLVQLSPAEITSAQSYINNIGIPGIVYNIISTASDKIMIKANIYYNGNYSSVIATNVIAEINKYLSNLSVDRFGGDLLLSDIKKLIRTVEGVNDVSIEKLVCRNNSQSIASGLLMVDGFDELQRKYTMDAGYIVEETTALNTFTDTLTFIPE